MQVFNLGLELGIKHQSLIGVSNLDTACFECHLLRNLIRVLDLLIIIVIILVKCSSIILV